MQYRILIKKIIRNNWDSVYSYYAEKDSDGNYFIFETSNSSELDNKLEELLEKYNKNELEVVSHIDYRIDAIIDVNEIYVNNITGSLNGGTLTYEMTGSNLYENEEYKWVMSYDGYVIEVDSVGLTRVAPSSEVVRYNGSTNVKAKIIKDNYVSEEFVIKSE